jgi:hypothetical protein
MPADRLIEDLRFVGRRFPKALIAFHDPNFGIKFDETLSALEQQDQRLPYMMESSLSVLKPARLARLGATNCVFVAPGIESWDDFSNKSGGASKKGMEKVESVADQFRDLHAHVPNLQANFIFGLDTDCGDEPIRLLKLFMDKTPFVWPTMNIPVPFGGTPLFDDLLRNGRFLEAKLPVDEITIWTGSPPIEAGSGGSEKTKAFIPSTALTLPCIRGLICWALRERSPQGLRMIPAIPWFGPNRPLTTKRSSASGNEVNALSSSAP